MPLRAIINGENIIAPFLSEDEWLRLKNRIKEQNLVVELPCCRQIAFLRTSKYGIQHFVHKERDNCTSAPETWQHLKAKQEIVLACKAAGYDAITEISGDGWRADTLATKGKQKIAFEVQWSPQNLAETEIRQQIYKNAEVRCCWFFKKMPVGNHHPPRRDLPMFQILIDEDEPSKVILDGKEFLLSDFVELLLRGKIRFCERITAKSMQSFEFKFIKIPCWKCGALYDVYRILSHFETDCGRSLTYHNYLYNTDSELNFEFHPEINAAIKAYLENAYAGKLRTLNLAKTTKYYQKTSRDQLDAFQCPHCEALLGHKYLMEVYCRKSEEENATVQIVFANPPSIREQDDYFGDLHGHWCYPDTGMFCCPK
jgi:hypothetical protein